MKNKKILFLTLLPLVICCSIGTHNTAALIAVKKSLNEDFVSNDVSILKENNSFYFCNDSFKFEIPEFYFYIIDSTFENEYFADVFAFDFADDEKFSFCNLSYLENENIIKTCFSYESVIYKTTIYDDVGYINKIKEKLFNINSVNNSSQIYENILDSINSVSNLANINNDVNAISSYNEIEVNNENYEYRTSVDRIAKDYKSIYMGNEIEDGLFVDDMITFLIPKDLFIKNNINISIGKECGFFIHTYDDPYTTYKKVSDVLVFDVECLFPSDKRDEDYKDMLSTTITPLFQGRYSTFFKNNDSSNWSEMHPSLNEIVLKHATQYSITNLYLSDIGMRHTLIDTDIITDSHLSGHYIENNSRTYAASSISCKGGSFAVDTIKFVGGCMKYVGNLLNLVDYLSNIYKGFNGEYYIDNTKSINVQTMSDNFTNIYRNKAEDQIKDYGYLVKDSLVDANSSLDSPMLIGTNSGFYSVHSLINEFKKSSYNDFGAIISYKINVIQDFTSRFWLFTWIEKGYLDKYTSGYGRYYYEYKELEID